MNAKNIVVSIAALALITACKPSPKAAAKPDFERLTVDIPSEKEGSTYCSIAQAGSYDIPLQDDAGQTVATLGRVCASYEEIRYNGDGPSHPARRTFDTDWNVTVKSSAVRVPRSLYQTEMYIAGVTPRQRLFLSKDSDPPLAWGCTSNPLSVSGHSSEFLSPTGASILSQAADVATIHITFYFSRRC